MYDTFILGQISKDINIDYDGTTVHEIGGAVIYSGFAAGAMGHKTAVLPKGSASKEQAKEYFAKARNVDVYPVFSSTDTSIKNEYHTADKERRTSTEISRIEAYQVGDIPDIEASIYHVAGLMYGDFGEDVLEYAHKKAKLAVDVQGLLRHMNKEGMCYKDWEQKHRYLPIIDFLKTDAAEAQILTGTEDRRRAAAMLADWGAKEIMITHNTEVLIYKDGKICTEPLKPRNLRGRSGRGDTCFSTYITERLSCGIEEALLTAAATVSLKMENPGPFMGGRSDVEEYIRQFYRS